MAGRNTAVTRLLVSLTIVHRDLSLPPKITALVRPAIDTKTHSTSSTTFNHQPQLGSALRSMTRQIDELVERFSCVFMERGPSNLRADAVQVRRRHAGRVTATFSQNLFTVEVPGDRADILSLEFPAESPAALAYVHRVSTVVDNYFGGLK